MVNDAIYSGNAGGASFRREGEVSVRCCMTLRQSSRDTSSQVKFLNLRKSGWRYGFGSHLYIQTLIKVLGMDNTACGTPSSSSGYGLVALRLGTVGACPQCTPLPLVPTSYDPLKTQVVDPNCAHCCYHQLLNGLPLMVSQLFIRFILPSSSQWSKASKY